MNPEPIWFRNPPRSTIDPAAPLEPQKPTVSITIDGRPLDLPAGATILDGCKTLGIEIPTLCWYPTLSIVGNCRICLVSVEGQPKLIPACATKVADGMAVTTQSHAAIESRRGVLRLLA